MLKLSEDAAVALVRMILRPDESWDPSKQYIARDKLARRDVGQLEGFCGKRLIGGPGAQVEALEAIAKLPDEVRGRALFKFMEQVSFQIQTGEFALKAVLRDRAKVMHEHYSKLWDEGTPPKGIRARHWEALRAALWGETFDDDFEDTPNGEGKTETQT